MQAHVTSTTHHNPLIAYRGAIDDVYLEGNCKSDLLLKIVRRSE